MPPFHLSTPVAISLDFVAWFIIHMGAAFIGSRIPRSAFQLGSWLYRVRPWEAGGHLYRRFLGVSRWKHLLPDGAAWFAGGSPKRSLRSTDWRYLETFTVEACRAEMTHWIAIAPVPIFFLWNPWPVGVFMIFYALVANMPCILTQRYNRARLGRVLVNGKQCIVGSRGIRSCGRL